MQIKIVRETATVNHGALSRGQIFTEKEIGEKTMQRWIKRGIAVEVKGEIKPVAKEEYFSLGEVMEQLQIKEEVEEPKTVISEMSFQELRRYAKENGYENYGKMNREQLIEMLSDEEEEEEEKSPFFDGVE